MAEKPFLSCFQNNNKRVLKFDRVEPGTLYATIKEAFSAHGKCFVTMVDGETQGYVKYVAVEMALLALAQHQKRPFTFGDNEILLRALTSKVESSISAISSEI